MSFFRPEIPLKQKDVTEHPWQSRIKDTYSEFYKYGHNSAHNPVYPKKEKKESEEVTKTPTRVTVIGQRTSKEFIYCYYLVKALHKYRNKKFEAPVIRGVTEVEWPSIWNDLKITFGAKAHCITSKVAVIVDNVFLGGENELKKYVESKYVYNLCLDYLNESIQQLANYIDFSGRPCAYMHISINGEQIGCMIFLLYSDIVPQTCENFLRLCETTKGGYSGTPVHRIVKDCWIQCGGYSLKENHNLGCENFIVPHDRRGVLCMSNAGRHVQCSTQFFVLLEPSPWMQHKYVAFGQLIEGEKVLKKIEKIPTWYESPTQDIIIYKAGIFNMQCQYAPINKNTNEYIQSHIENLYEIGELLMKELWDRVSHEIYLLEQQAEGEGMSEDTRSEANNDFDVEVYAYEAHDYSGAQVSDEPISKPELPFYIPLTDVPYPDEVDSEYNLQRLLKGDYCYEQDLETDTKKDQQKHKGRRLSIPEELVGALFECFEFEGTDDEYDSSDSSERSNTSSVERYIAENMDHVSFAGPIIKQIANLARKYEVFDDTKTDEAMNRFLTDDELRIIRMAIKEYKSVRQKRVSINLSSAKLSHTKIIRRPTGYIHMEDLEKLGVNSQTYENIEEATREDETLGFKKIVRILDSNYAEPARPKTTDMPRESVLMRLLEDVAMGDSSDVVPTLKDYKPHVPASEKPFYLINFSATRNLVADPEDTSKHSKRPIDHVLQLQHGSKIYRKLSSDYVRTINHLENPEAPSQLPASTYLKRRPWMTVAQYKMKNKKNEDMKNMPAQ